nr:hypothetical protein [uncultured archaeon]
MYFDFPKKGKNHNLFITEQSRIMMQYTLRHLRERFEQNPVGFIGWRKLRKIHGRTFQKTFVEPSHEQAVESFPPRERESESFFRLYGLGEAAYRKVHTCGALVMYAGKYDLWKNHIAEANTPLLTFLVSKASRRHRDIDDLYSAGGEAMSRAIDRFNAWAGYRFSTYASNAILRAFSSLIRDESKYRARFPVYLDPKLEKPSSREEIDDVSFLAEKVRQIMDENSAELTEFELRIIDARITSDGRRPTLEQLGDEAGVSKETIRHMEGEALMRIRLELTKMAGDYPLSPSAGVFLRHGKDYYKNKNNGQKKPANQVV